MDDDVSGVEMEDDLEMEERATARGPDVIGMEDIGPQGPNTQTFAVDTSPERTRHEELFSAHQEQENTQIADDGGSVNQKENTRPNPDPPDRDHDQNPQGEREGEREGETGQEKEKDDSFSLSRLDDIMPDAADTTAPS